MKLLLSLLFTSSFIFTGMSQNVSSEVVGVAGGYYLNPSGFNLHWTIGESFISHHEDENFTLSEGFHQTFGNNIIDNIWENAENEFNFNVFPNPTSDWIIITSNYPKKIKIVISNIIGQQVLKTQIMDIEKKEIDIQSLPAGTYLLSILNDKQLLKTYKIIKQ